MAQDEGEGEGEEDMLDLITPSFVLGHLYHDAKPLMFGIIISIIFAIKIFKNKMSIRKKLYYILLPLIISLVMTLISNAPSPKRAYSLNLLYGDEPIQSEHIHRNENGWMFSGSTVINIHDKPHIFVGGGDKQKDQLLLFENSKFINLIDETILSDDSNTLSAVSFDMDNDGKDDLIVGRTNCVYMYKHMNGYIFEKIRIIGKEDKVPLAISVSDYNKDGKPDIYISYFTHLKKYRGTVFNDKNHGRKNVLLKNSKVGFIDVTKNTNAGGSQYNTFTSSFIDLNGDDWVDLVLAHDSGEIEILKNNEGKFESILANEYKGNWMGLASGDIDNDGDQDLFLTNIGSDTRRDKLSLGDVKKGQKQAFKHFLLRNDGNFKFTEISKDMGIDGKGFGWGAVMTDLDADSDLDLLFAENTKLFPLHHVNPKPGHVYSMDKGKFTRKMKYFNRYFGQTPLLADINDDNRKDVIWINMNGPVNAYINKNNDNNYIVVDLPSNNKFVNAKVVLDTGKKKFYKENVQGGTGMGSDGSNKLFFGLGKTNKIKAIRIHTIHNDTYTIKNPKINSVIKGIKNAIRS